ncbi:MAG: hypothetical protein KBA81_01695 [Rhabdochlamydiaceae bacterium]|nr:hypothetical protein [Rhabdochlamydiaceae bacterium]
MTDSDQIQLSVVATSRNDNHGKNLLYRMQQFVDGFIEQCKRHDLKAELILVEWNPPDNTPPLSQALHFPNDKGPCTVRIIRVPHNIHSKLENADKIPLFQMIGKNVGIRRAAGKFILATNIDIIFSDKLIKYLKNRLKTGHLYRTDRLDIPEILPENASFDEILHFCSTNVFRINTKNGTFFVSEYSFIKNLFGKLLHHAKKNVKRVYNFIINSSIKDLVMRHPLFLIKTLRLVKLKLFQKNAFFPHTNACGDFTLLSSQDWATLKGYPEWNIFSWHLDSVFIFQARQHGIIEIDLPIKLPIYHIEHEAGSGFSPESAHLLFNRLHQKGIPYIDNSSLHDIILQMKNSQEKVIYNSQDWGMAELSLEETTV